MDYLISTLPCNNSVDVLQYSKDRKKIILSKLIEGTISAEPVICIFETDNSCLWNVGMIHRMDLDKRVNQGLMTSHRNSKCKNCELVQKLVGSHITNFPYTFLVQSISNGKHKQEELVIIEKEWTQFFEIETGTPLLRYISSFDENNPPVCNNYCTSKNVKYIVVDSLTCGTLLSWYIENITTKVIKNYNTFVCSEKVYMVNESFKKIDFSTIPDNTILNVVRQIFKILTELSPYDFSISNADEVFVSDKGYDIRLSNLGSCSITMVQLESLGRNGNISHLDNLGRNGNISHLDNLGLNGNISHLNFADCKVSSGIRVSPKFLRTFEEKFDLIVQRSVYTDLNMKERILYKITNLSGLQQLLFSSVPFYRSSLNTYLMLIHLLSFQNIRQFFYSYKEIYNLFKGLWLPGEFVNLKLNLEDLERFRLRCDALEYFYNGIQKITSL